MDMKHVSVADTLTGILPPLFVHSHQATLWATVSGGKQSVGGRMTAKLLFKPCSKHEKFERQGQTDLEMVSIVPDVTADTYFGRCELSRARNIDL